MRTDSDGMAHPAQEDQDLSYYPLLEQLTQLMTGQNNFNVPGIYAVLEKLCVILRVSKGVTTFYDSPEQEHIGHGEEYVCYDSGEESRLVSSMRVVTPARIVGTCDVYQAVTSALLSDVEKSRVELIQRMMLTYLNRSRQEKIINKLTYWDSEGYLNLRYFFKELTQMIRQGALKGKAALRMNLKHFSLINEQIGRAAGDQVMRSYCALLKDALGEEGILVRMGGDNFAALCDEAHLPRVMQCLRGHPITYDEENHQRVEVAGAAGLFLISNPEEIHDPGDIMDRIIAAYNVAKRSSTDDLMFYSTKMQQERERVIRIQQAFDKAIKDQEFLAYYQPKVDVVTKELIGAEALCRWQHDGKLIVPMDFIPALERGMDICRLDFYMLDRACADIRRWLDQGLKAVRISVNLSRRHMMDPDLFEHIVHIIDSHRVPHEYIEIELTETTTDVEFKDLKRVVNALQEAGIHTSVDDFGVGYSSLNLIKQIPWDVLKLDKSMLPAAGDKLERSSPLFAHVVAMAHEMGLKCVAEGVETQEQLEVLQRNGCRIAQGFLFDKPLPVEEFEKRVRRHTYG